MLIFVPGLFCCMTDVQQQKAEPMTCVTFRKVPAVEKGFTSPLASAFHLKRSINSFHNKTKG